MVELFQGIKVDWLAKRKVFFAISIALLLVGMVSLAMKGQFRYGLDFKGGTLVRVEFKEAVDIGEVRKLLPKANIQTATQTGSQVKVYQIELENEGGSSGQAAQANAGRELVTQALNK